MFSALEIEKLNFSSLFGIYFHCYPVLFSTQVSDIGPSWSSCLTTFCHFCRIKKCLATLPVWRSLEFVVWVKTQGQQFSRWQIFRLVHFKGICRWQFRYGSSLGIFLWKDCKHFGIWMNRSTPVFSLSLWVFQKPSSWDLDSQITGLIVLWLTNATACANDFQQALFFFNRMESYSRQIHPWEISVQNVYMNFWNGQLNRQVDRYVFILYYCYLVNSSWEK